MNLHKEARYQEIALEISKRITCGKLKVGDKLRGRSILSSEFNVSSETVRKAIRLLANHGVVEVKERSGNIVISEIKAIEYIDMYKKKEQNRELYNEIEILFEKEIELIQQLHHKVKDYEKNCQHRNYFPFEYFTITIKDDCPYIGTPLKEIPFWENTTGTIIGIKQNRNLETSPNPSTIVEENNVLYVLGDESVYKKALSFLKINP